jgi:hypothetical protein
MKSQKNSLLVVQSRIVSFLLPAILVIGLSLALGADFWESKDYGKWSDRECVKMLQESPWAQEYKLFRMGGSGKTDVTQNDPSKGLQDAKRDSGSLASSDAAGGQQYIKYEVQFFSALPVRQAVVRQARIANKYDGLTPEQQQAFDKSAGEYLSADYSNTVVVRVGYSTNIQSLDLDLARYWQSKTLSVIQNSVYLTPSKGTKVALLDFKVAQGARREFQFAFPRQRDGQPLLNEKDSSITLEFPYPTSKEIGTMGEMAGDGRAVIEFKTKKMVFKGQIEY